MGSRWDLDRYLDKDVDRYLDRDLDSLLININRASQALELEARLHPMMKMHLARGG